MLSALQQKRLLILLVTLISVLFFSAIYSIKQPEGPAQTQSEYKYSETGQKSEAHETYRQWLTKDAASFFTFILALLTAVLAVVSVVQIFYLRRSDDTARRTADAALKAADAAYKQAEISEKALISTDRPWITVNVELAGDAETSKTDVKFTFKFTMKNIGNSPALKVHLAPILLDRMSCTPQIREFIHTTFMDSHILKNFAWGRSMAPNQERSLFYSLGFRPDMFEAVVSTNKVLSPNNDRILIAPMLAGIIQYEFNNSPLIHTTTFYYDIGRAMVLPASHGSSGTFIYYFTEDIVPIDRIHLEESFSCGAELS